MRTSEIINAVGLFASILCLGFAVDNLQSGNHLNGILNLSIGIVCGIINFNSLRGK